MSPRPRRGRGDQQGEARSCEQADRWTWASPIRLADATTCCVGVPLRSAARRHSVTHGVAGVVVRTGKAVGNSQPRRGERQQNFVRRHRRLCNRVSKVILASCTMSRTALAVRASASGSRPRNHQETRTWLDRRVRVSAFGESAARTSGRCPIGRSRGHSLMEPQRSSTRAISRRRRGRARSGAWRESPVSARRGSLDGRCRSAPRRARAGSGRGGSRRRTR